MSTRAVVHFREGGATIAMVYRHPDGYPEGLGQDLLDFLSEVQENVQDTRFGDPSYLAAKWVVRDAQRYAGKFTAGERIQAHSLDFLSVGIVMQEPGDIEFRYFVNCDGGMPMVEVEGVSDGGAGVGRRALFIRR